MPTLENDIVRATAVLRHRDQGEIQNVFHFKVTNASPKSDDDLIDGIGEALEDIYDLFDGPLSEDMTFDTYAVYIYRGTQALGSHSWPTLTVGAGTGGVMPPGVAVLTLARTSTSRRIGRKYWGSFTEVDSVDGAWSTGLVAFLLNAANTAYSVFSTVSGMSMKGVIYDRTLGVARDALTISVDTNPAYQRRRRLGVGS